MLPGPPLVDVTAPVVLFLVPGVAPVTVTLNMHVPLAPIEAAVSMMVLGLVVVSVPPQVAVCPEVATVNPAGSMSVNPTPVKATVEFEFVIVKVSTLVPPCGIVAASNAFEIDGGPITVRIAVLLAVPGALSFEVIAPDVLFHTPTVEPVTVTMT